MVFRAVECHRTPGRRVKGLSVKWAYLACFAAAMFPLSAWLRRSPQHSPKIWMLVGFLPFVTDYLHLFMAFDSWLFWPGYVKGVEFSVLDGLALALFFSLPRSRDRLPFLIPMTLYFLAVLLSVLQAAVPEAALFYPWQLSRMFLVYAVVTKACADERVAPALLTGMAAGIMLEAGFTVIQRFGLGMLQAVGTIGHQNLLGMMSHFVIFPLFALMLAGQGGWIAPIAVMAGAIVELLTASRATLGLAGLAYVAVFALSALQRWTPRKAVTLFVGVALVAAITPIALSSIAKRGEDQLEGSDQERVIFKNAASAILSDYPLGVGANHYVMIANVGGYNQKYGLSWTSDRANVHNVYYLVADETGYLGLITFMILLLRPLTVAFPCAFRYRGDPRGDLLLGLGVAMLTVYIHSNFEWVFITFEPQYLFAMDMGLVAGLAQQLGYWQRPYRKNIPFGVGALPKEQQKAFSKTTG